MKILIVGANGMIGSAMIRVLSEQQDYEIFGTVRSKNSLDFFPHSIRSRLLTSVDLNCIDSLFGVLNKVMPDVVINCAGLTKHKQEGGIPLFSIPINALMPHRLAELCKLIHARFIHISTDCVFSGYKGNYSETDLPDAVDIYGKSKALGEVSDMNTITLRTSTIGHELDTKYGLLDWFLSQEVMCSGYSRAIFSGLPSVVLAQVIRDVVIPNSTLSGLYQVGAGPIDKFNLLKLIANVYGKSVDIVEDDSFIIDRSFSSDKFYADTGYMAPEWAELVRVMHLYR